MIWVISSDVSKKPENAPPKTHFMDPKIFRFRGAMDFVSSCRFFVMLCVNTANASLATFSSPSICKSDMESGNKDGHCRGEIKMPPLALFMSVRGVFPHSTTSTYPSLAPASNINGPNITERWYPPPGVVEFLKYFKTFDTRENSVLAVFISWYAIKLIRTDLSAGLSPRAPSNSLWYRRRRKVDATPESDFISSSKLIRAWKYLASTDKSAALRNEIWRSTFARRIDMRPFYYMASVTLRMVGILVGTRLA